MLGLGSLVLLTGLTAPGATPNDLVMLVIPARTAGLSLPQWLAGAGMIGMALVAMRAAPTHAIASCAARERGLAGDATPIQRVHVGDCLREGPEVPADVDR